MTNKIYFKSYENYKGGVNNLYVVCDEFGNIATSIKSHKQAIKNLGKILK